MIPLNIQCFERGISGSPASAQPITVDLGKKVDSYVHSISSKFGFETMQLSFKASLDEALDWLFNGLMRSTVVTGPNAQVVWEGFLETVSVTVGQKRASVSLATVGNRCRVFGTTAGGTPVNSSIVNNTASQLIYGIKEQNQTLQGLSAVISEAQAISDLVANRMLTTYAFPRSPESSQAMTGASGEIEVELTFSGWYGTLGWLTGSNYSYAQVDTGTQISGIITAVNIVNPFFISTDTSQIITTGVTDSEYIADGTFYIKKVERLLELGNSSQQPLSWGVYDNRRMSVQVWAGSTPSVIKYTEDAGTGTITDDNGSIVAPWDVRPNAMSQIVQFSVPGIPVNAIDSASRKFVGRVTCSIRGDSIGCTLEPGDLDSVEAYLTMMRIG